MVHQWRPILDWKEEQVWDIIERWRVRPHPACQLDWGRTSCLACILGYDDQWASVNKPDPKRFRRVADLERRLGATIKNGQTVEEMARRGTKFVSDKSEELRRLAMSPDALGTISKTGEPAGLSRRDKPGSSPKPIFEIVP